MSEMFSDARKAKAKCSCPYCGMSLNVKDDYIAVSTECRNIWMCVLCADSMAKRLKSAVKELT